MQALKDWLIQSIQHDSTLSDTISAFAQALRKRNILVDRLFVGHTFLHPLFFNALYNWNSSTQQTTVKHINSKAQRGQMFTNSPVQHLMQTEKPIHLKLNGEDSGFEIVNALHDKGFTEYILYPIHRKNETTIGFQFYAFSISTKAPNGFPNDILDTIKDFEASLSIVLEYHRLLTEQTVLANCYIGHRAGKRVLSGQIRRGDTETIEAFVWLCDLRSFTQLSDTYPSTVILDLLNSYFDIVVSEIQAAGGEVLKYIGDAVLAIFERRSDLKPQAQAIIQAAQKAQQRLQALNTERHAKELPPIEVGIGLHYGEVSYGNIGTTDRLDFTVIGSAINHCSRIEAQCKPLQSNILCSSVFAKHHTHLEALAEVQLKGIKDPQWIFRPYAP